MSKIMMTLILCLLWAKVDGQATFNKRTRFGFEAAVLTSVLPTDSCYYATGIIADTVFPYNTGNVFTKLDLMGEFVLVKTLEDTEKTYEAWENTLVGVEDDGFYLSGYSFDSTMKALLIRYGHDGDTLWTKEYFNNYYPEQSFLRPMDFFMGGDGNVYMCNRHATLQLGNTDISVLKADSEGEMIYHNVYGTGLREQPMVIVPSPNGGVIFGGGRNNTNFTTSNYTYQTYLTSLDSLGNVEWAYLSHPDSLRDAANDMLLLEDGSLIVASGVGHEIESSSVNKVYFDKYVFKLDPQREIEWELTFDTPEETGRIWTSVLVGLSDGSGYVMAGTELGELPPPVYGNIYGWLGKVSPEGDSIWTRRYTYMDDQTYYNKIYDMKETTDGGLILCGESLNESPGATYPQQAWLLKLDGHGCLVPGCEAGDTVILDNTGLPLLPGLRLAIYPNPTTDYLNFQLRGVGGDVGRDALFRIIDVQGRVVREFAAGGRDETYIVPVWDWGGGVYFLQYVEGGEVRATERFMVSH